MVCEKSSNKKKGKDAADDPPNGGHDNGKRPSTKDKHEKGDERRIRDQGREKKEERMKY